MSPQTVRLRWLLDPPRDGAQNMARDEALLDAVACGDSPATIRFYAWEPPAISLGYFQAIDDFRRLPPPAGALQVVRRTTGGGAILHDRELTYSLVLPAAHPWLGSSVRVLYERMHLAIIHAVGPAARLCGCGDDPPSPPFARGGGNTQRGPFFCFARRHALDVVVCDGGLKLAGSAQRRTRQAVLQHGSLILDSRFEQQPCATWASLGGPTDCREAAQRLAVAMAEVKDCVLEPAAWSECELRAAESLRAKYASAAWTGQR